MQYPFHYKLNKGKTIVQNSNSLGLGIHNKRKMRVFKYLVLDQIRFGDYRPQRREWRKQQKVITYWLTSHY